MELTKPPLPSSSRPFLIFCIFSRAEPAEHHPDADRDNPDGSSSSSRASTKSSSSSSSSLAQSNGGAAAAAAEHRRERPGRSDDPSHGRAASCRRGAEHPSQPGGGRRAPVPRLPGGGEAGGCRSVCSDHEHTRHDCCPRIPAADSAAAALQRAAAEFEPPHQLDLPAPHHCQQPQPALQHSQPQPAAGRDLKTTNHFPTSSTANNLAGSQPPRTTSSPPPFPLTATSPETSPTGASSTSSSYLTTASSTTRPPPTSSTSTTACSTTTSPSATAGTACSCPAAATAPGATAASPAACPVLPNAGSPDGSSVPGFHHATHGQPAAAPVLPPHPPAAAAAATATAASAAAWSPPARSAAPAGASLWHRGGPVSPQISGIERRRFGVHVAVPRGPQEESLDTSLP